MKDIIVFDSDFIISNINGLKEYLSKFVDYDCYISAISIKEVATKNSFDKIDNILDFKDKVKNYQTLGIKFSNNDEKMKKIIFEESEKFIKSIFKSKIISSQNRSMDLILKRAYDKIPPFSKSDKGLKDTLILLDVIDYIKLYKAKKLFFVTNDIDFIGAKASIESEVQGEIKCVFNIVDGKNTDKLLNYFNIGNAKDIEKLSEQITESKDIDIIELRANLNNICFNLFYYKDYDQYIDEEYIGNNFVSSNYIKREEIKQFLDELSFNINKNIFNTSLTISDFFSDPFLFSNEKYIDINVFEKLNEIYLKIKDNENYTSALINLLYSNFIKLVKITKSNDEDLPF